MAQLLSKRGSRSPVSTPAKHFKYSLPCWCGLPRQHLPLDILSHCFEFLNFSEVTQKVSLACKYWRFAWRLFTSQNSSSFRSFSSFKHSSEDLLEMMCQAANQPLVRALTDFMALNDITSLIDIRYLLRTVILTTETVSPSELKKLFKTFRIKHVNHLGELRLVTSKALSHVCLLSTDSLVDLSLENCSNIDSSVSQTISTCENLKSVNLSFSGLDEDGLRNVTEGCKKLKVLILRGVQRIGPGCLSIIGKTKVEVLDLSHSQNLISQQGLGSSLDALPLTHLSLNGLDLLDADVGSLSVHSDLRLLSLANCHRLSDLSLVHISKLQALQCLNLDCFACELSQFTEMTLHHVLKCYCKQVTKLQVPQHLLSLRLKQLMRSRQ